MPTIATVKTEKQAPRLPAGELRLQEHGARKFVAYISRDVEKEDVLRPEFWANVSGTLMTWDEIELRREDRRFRVNVLVKNAGRAYADVMVTAYDVLNAAPPQATVIPEGYKVDWRGDRSLWGVLRGADVIRDGFQTDSAALDWLHNYIKSHPEGVKPKRE